MTDVKTACPLDCWDACSMVARVNDGKITALFGDPNHPVTAGNICSRGHRLLSRTNSLHRVTEPLKKINGRFVPISWDTALDEISSEIQKILHTHGHHAILHNYDFGSGTLLKNLNQRFFYKLGGCTETVGSLCWDAGLTAQRYDLGQARSHSPTDLHHARKIVVWGRNLPVTNMHMVPFIRRALMQGAELAVVNPLRTDLDAKASLILRPRPGTDAALALGVLRICRDNGWLDDEFIRTSSTGFEELSHYLDIFTTETVEHETGVPAHQIQALAVWYGQANPVATLLGIGLQRYRGGGNTVRAIDALAAATGQLGIPGGGVNYANRQMTEFLDEGALLSRADADVREFARGFQAEEIVRAVPKIQMMFVTRTNPVSQVPNTDSLRSAFRQIPTIVVIDTMLTATAQMANYILPCTTVLEEEDISFSTMWHPYITYAHRVIEPMGDTKPDHEIFTLLAERLGFGDDMRKPLDEWFTMALQPLFATGITLAGLKQSGTVRIPLPEVPWADRIFTTPSGRFEFSSRLAIEDGASAHATYIAPVGRGTSLNTDEREQSEYPYQLLTIHPRTSENSQHRDWPVTPDRPIAEVSAQIAEDAGLLDGDLAHITTPYGQLPVRVKVFGDGHPSVVKLESGWWHQQATINQLTPVLAADLGVQTAQYAVSCQIRKEA